MNKLVLSTMAAVLLISASLQAQIKDQFQDSSNGSTTIVVKEDNANDMDILNEQFDLDDVGMHQVIRITTRKEVATTPVPEEVPIEEPILTASVDFTPEKTEETLTETVKEEQIEEKPMPAEASAKTVTQKAKRSSTSSKRYKRKSSNHKFKVFNKRFKKQKRKRVPRKKKRNKRCYRF